jgi:hypothetical protein
MNPPLRGRTAPVATTDGSGTTANKLRVPLDIRPAPPLEVTVSLAPEEPLDETYLLVRGMGDEPTKAFKLADGKREGWMIRMSLRWEELPSVVELWLQHAQMLRPVAGPFLKTDVQRALLQGDTEQAGWLMLGGF